MQTHDLFGDVGGGAQPSSAASDDFEAFWASYPRKRAKLDARKAWKGLSKALRAEAMHALPRHQAHWRAHKTDLVHVPYPATWLRGHQWEDELEPVAAQPAQTAGVERWWLTHMTMERKGIEVGIGRARAGETTEQYRARIQMALEDQARFAHTQGAAS
jgi:hypothetical protein